MSVLAPRERCRRWLSVCVRAGFLVDARGDYYHYYGIVNFDLIFVVISVCLAIHVVLYGLLAGGGRIPRVKERLESWSFAMILLVRIGLWPPDTAEPQPVESYAR